jgi:ribose-phosphate pyrophosphokinase
MSMSASNFRLFALEDTKGFGALVGKEMAEPLQPHEERIFEDGERKLRPLVSVRGADVYVVQSLHDGPKSSVHDKLCHLAFFLGALKESGAAHLTAAIPYLCYARKDRRTKPRDPVTTRYVAAMLEAVGVDRIVALDVHNVAAFENAFRVETVHLEMRKAFVERIIAFFRDDKRRAIVVISPDAGGAKRAEALRQSLEGKLDRAVGMGFLEKYRSAGVTSGELLVGNVEGKTAIIVDDLVSSGGTLARAARACKAARADAVLAVASHGLFVGQAAKSLAEAPIDCLFVSDSISPLRVDVAPARRRIELVSAAPLFAEAIGRLHGGGSVSELLSL